MTANPELFRSALESAIGTWAIATGQEPPSALFCADPHTLDPAVLCRRLDGHSGLHGSDEGPAWEDEVSDLHTLSCAVWTTLRSPCDCGAGEQR